MLRRLFSHAPEPVPEVPEIEPPDPATNRSLSDSYRHARRNLVAVTAACLAWSTAQFGVRDLEIDAVGIRLDLNDGSIPLLLGATLAYLTARWVMEFAMMGRHVRRWRLAQLDFHVISIVSRFALLALAAAALDRSLKTVVVVIALLGGLALVSGLLMFPLMFMTMWIRMRARERANRSSAANAAVEASVWALLFAVLLTVGGSLAMGVASYQYEPFRNVIWTTPPNPWTFAAFVVTLNGVFLSFFVQRGAVAQLFAERPSYFTTRTPEGNLQMTIVDRPKEPLL